MTHNLKERKKERKEDGFDTNKINKSRMAIH